MLRAEPAQPAKHSFYLSNRPPNSLQPPGTQDSLNSRPAAVRPTAAAVHHPHRPPPPRKLAKPVLAQHDEDVSCLPACCLLPVHVPALLLGCSDVWRPGLLGRSCTLLPALCCQMCLEQCPSAGQGSQ